MGIDELSLTDRHGPGRSTDPVDPSVGSVCDARGRRIGALRLVLGTGALGTVAIALVDQLRRHPVDLLDFFGYFTMQTNVLLGLILVATGCLGIGARARPFWLESARAVWTTYIVVVGIVYNTGAARGGDAPFWVSMTLHLFVPVLAALEWTMIDDRPVMPWRRLWIVVPYLLAWVAVVLVRGATDGWVPYGFLLPERGYASVAGMCGLLLVAVLGVATVVWALSRRRSRAGSRRV